jgi:hypothetical protein
VLAQTPKSPVPPNFCGIRLSRSTAAKMPRYGAIDPATPPAVRPSRNAAPLPGAFRALRRDGEAALPARASDALPSVRLATRRPRESTPDEETARRVRRRRSAAPAPQRQRTPTTAPPPRARVLASEARKTGELTRRNMAKSNARREEYDAHQRDGTTVRRTTRLAGKRSIPRLA